jgi:hypothetical protein
LYCMHFLFTYIWYICFTAIVLLHKEHLVVFG